MSKSRHYWCKKSNVRVKESVFNENRFLGEEAIVLCALYTMSTIETLAEKRLNTTPYFPVYGFRMPIYGSNLSQYGKIRDRIQAFFVLWKNMQI